MKSSGGDYSSLSSAEAGEQGNLVTLDRVLEIACYSMTDTTGTTIDGWTTDATRYIRVYTPSTERHAGVWNTGKYNLSVSTAFVIGISIMEDYVRIEGLQIEHTNATGYRPLAVSATAAAASCDIRIDSCLVRKGGGGTGQIDIGSGQVTIRNSVFYAALAGTTNGIYCTFNSNSPTVNCDNVTVAGSRSYGFNRVSGTMTLRNCYSGGNTTDAYTGTITRTTCAHDTATSFSNSTGSVAHSTSTFTNVTSGSEDYHLVSGSGLIDVGTDLSGTFTTDIDGDTRSGTWDIGADEYVSAATGQPTWKRFGGVAFASGGYQPGSGRMVW